MDKYQWSSATKAAIELIVRELSKRNDFTVTIEQAVEVATKHYVRSVLEVDLPSPNSVGYQHRDDLLRRVDEFDWSVRTGNVLEDAGIEYIWQIVERTPYKMLRVKNCGRKSTHEVFDRLAEFELTLGMELHPTDKFLVSNESVAEEGWKKPIGWSPTAQ